MDEKKGRSGVEKNSPRNPLKNGLFFIFFLSAFLLNLYPADKTVRNSSDILKDLETELSDVHVTISDDGAKWKLEKKGKKGEINADTIIKLLEPQNRINTIEVQDIALSGILDFTRIPVRSYLGSDVHLIDKHLTFKSCFFKGKINSKRTGSQKVVFKGLAFIDCIFEKEVRFEGSRFENVKFIDSIFQQNAVFNRAQFKGDENYFLNVEFIGDVIFALSTFEGKIAFNIICRSNALFNYVKSKKEINFSRSTFWGEFDFGVSELYGPTTFKNVTFGGQLFFTKVKMKKKERNPIALNFDGSNFKSKAYFRESSLENVRFRPSQDRPLIFFSEADFRGVNFYNVDFGNASFDVVDFTNANFGKRDDVCNLSIKNCSYEKILVSWKQLSKAIGNDMSDRDYENLISNFEKNGQYDDACEAYYRMKTLEKTSNVFDWLWNKISKVLFGYFVRPFHIVIVALIFIIIFSLFYASLDLQKLKANFVSQKEGEKTYTYDIKFKPESSIVELKLKPVDVKQLQAQKIKLVTYLKNLPLAILFSFTIFISLKNEAKYTGCIPKKWIRWMAHVEWYLCFLFWSVFIYALAKRSSILHEILSGLPIF